MGAIAQQAQKVAGEDKALDEAVKDFAGEALPQEAAEKPAEKRIHVECLVVGYTTRKGNSRRFASLVVAADVGGKLKIVGFVSGGIPKHIRADLDTRLRQLSRQKPFVESELLAHWVEPVVTCEVSCKRRTASGHLIEPVFERLLQEVELGR